MNRALITDVNNSLMGGSIEPTYLPSLAGYFLGTGQIKNGLRIIYYFLACSGAYLRGRSLTSLVRLYAEALTGTPKDVLMEKASATRYDTRRWDLASRIPAGILKVPRPIPQIANIILKASESDVKTGILSCSLGDMLVPWLSHYGLTVDAIHVNKLKYNGECVSGLRMNVVPHKKEEALKPLMKELGVLPSQVVYFGDDEHDLKPILSVKEAGGEAVISPLATRSVKMMCVEYDVFVPTNFSEASDVLCSALFSQ